MGVDRRTRTSHVDMISEACIHIDAFHWIPYSWQMLSISRYIVDQLRTELSSKCSDRECMPNAIASVEKKNRSRQHIRPPSLWIAALAWGHSISRIVSSREGVRLGINILLERDSREKMRFSCVYYVKANWCTMGQQYNHTNTSNRQLRSRDRNATLV